MSSANNNKPTNRNVERLLRELRGWDIHNRFRERLDDLRETESFVREKLLSDRSYVRIRKEIEALEAEIDQQAKQFDQKVRAVRQRYYAHGATEAVMKDVQNLVKELQGK